MTELAQLSEDQRDCLQELVNVAMGQAGDSLARFLEVFVHLSVPRIKLVASDEVLPEMIQLIGNIDVSAVRQGFYSTSQQVRGEAIVVFSKTSFDELAEIMAYEPDEVNEQSEQELLLDITNILNGACLSGLAEQLGYELNYSPPSLIGTELNVGRLFDKEQLSWSQALLIEINYRLDNESFKCNLLMLMPGESIEVIKQSVDEFLEDL